MIPHREEFNTYPSKFAPAVVFPALWVLLAGWPVGCENRGVNLSPTPAPGDLLVATAGGSDTFFDQSVVLLLDCDADGTVGLALNKLAPTPLEAVLPQWLELVAPPRLLFAGGPVSPNGAV